ncbi:MAG: hypothetical protein E7473_05145 [Ruminococcaceae bacterium]|nr:hypothetical protein [Oscillospiraceae bacterium]
MKKLKEIILNNKGKIFLLAVAALTIFLFIKSTILSSDYNARLQNKVSVISTVTDIQEKTRTEETTYDVGEETKTVESEVTYYVIKTIYEYNNQKYNHSFNSDSLYIDNNSGESYSIGKELPLLIDSTDPKYVFDENPGKAYRIASYIFAGLLLVVLFFFIIYKFFPKKMFKALFVYPWLLAAIFTCVFGFKLIIANKTGITGYLLTFILTPIYIAVWLLFSKLSKIN